MAKGDPSGQYQPEGFSGAPEDTSLIIAWITRELQKVSGAFELGVSRNVEVLNVAPDKPRDGMVRVADGVNWNPGKGAGPYIYVNGVWVFCATPPTDPTLLVLPGIMVDYGGTAVQTGYLLCDGSNVSRTTYAALFTSIGTTWGVGDGSTTFGLPDSRRRASVGKGGTGTATLGNAVGNTGGEETHTLVAAEVPNLGGLPGGISSGGSPTGNLATQGTNASPNYGTTTTTGGGGAHNTIQPSYVVTKMIKT